MHSEERSFMSEFSKRTTTEFKTEAQEHACRESLGSSYHVN